MKKYVNGPYFINTLYKWRIDTWYKNLYYYLVDFYRGIINVIHWIPVIWLDRDWDYYYLARVMEYKLRKMAFTIGDYGHHTNAEKDAKKMLDCANILRKLQEDSYSNPEEAQKEAEKLGRILGKNLLKWWD